MKLLFIIPQEFEGNTWGGIMSYVVDMTRVLQKNKNNVSILTPGRLSQQFVRYGVDYYKISLAPSFPWWTVIVVKIIKRFAPDVYVRICWAYAVRLFLLSHPDFDAIEAPEWGSSTLFLPFWRRPRVVVRLHKSEFQYQRDNMFPVVFTTYVIDCLERFCMWTASAISSPTQFMMNQYPLCSLYMKMRGMPIQHIPNGVLASSQSSARSVVRQPYVLTVGRLEVAKGSALLLRAFMRIAKEYPRLHLYFIGEDTQMYVHDKWISYKKYMASLFSGKPYTKRIHFISRRSRAVLVQFYTNCLFYVVPSRGHENASMSLLEALAYGKAVVASDAGGSPEIVNTRKNGIVFTADDVSDLTKAMRYLLQHPSQVKMYAAKARRSTMSLAMSAMLTEKMFRSIMS